MKTYSFDVKLQAVAQVQAASHKEAAKLLEDNMDSIELEYRALYDTGAIELTEASLCADPELYAVDHEEIVICPECGAVEGEPEWGTVGDGHDGYCPNCADKREESEDA